MESIKFDFQQEMDVLIQRTETKLKERDSRMEDLHKRALESVRENYDMSNKKIEEIKKIVADMDESRLAEEKKIAQQIGKLFKQLEKDEEQFATMGTTLDNLSSKLAEIEEQVNKIPSRGGTPTPQQVLQLPDNLLTTDDIKTLEYELEQLEKKLGEETKEISEGLKTESERAKIEEQKIKRDLLKKTDAAEKTLKTLVPKVEELESQVQDTLKSFGERVDDLNSKLPDKVSKLDLSTQIARIHERVTPLETFSNYSKPEIQKVPGIEGDVQGFTSKLEELRAEIQARVEDIQEEKKVQEQRDEPCAWCISCSRSLNPSDEDWGESVVHNRFGLHSKVVAHRPTTDYYSPDAVYRSGFKMPPHHVGWSRDPAGGWDFEAGSASAPAPADAQLNFVSEPPRQTSAVLESIQPDAQPVGHAALPSLSQRHSPMKGEAGFGAVWGIDNRGRAVLNSKAGKAPAPPTSPRSRRMDPRDPPHPGRGPPADTVVSQETSTGEVLGASNFNFAISNDNTGNEAPAEMLSPDPEQVPETLPEQATS